MFAPALLTRPKKRPIETPALRARALVAAAARATPSAADVVEFVTASQGADAGVASGAIPARCNEGSDTAETDALPFTAMMRLSSGAVGGASGVAPTT